MIYKVFLPFSLYYLRIAQFQVELLPENSDYSIVLTLSVSIIQQSPIFPYKHTRSLTKTEPSRTIYTLSNHAIFQISTL